MSHFRFFRWFTWRLRLRPDFEEFEKMRAKQAAGVPHGDMPENSESEEVEGPAGA